MSHSRAHGREIEPETEETLSWYYELKSGGPMNAEERERQKAWVAAHHELQRLFFMGRFDGHPPENVEDGVCTRESIMAEFGITEHYLDVKCASYRLALGTTPLRILAERTPIRIAFPGETKPRRSMLETLEALREEVLGVINQLRPFA